MRPTPDTQVLADATATPPRRNVARWGRRVAVAFVVYLAVAIGTHAMLIGAVLVARAVSDDPRDDFYGIANFRRVDDRVWAGAQPIPLAYDDLEAQGVRLIIDLRTGASDDPHEVDLEHLRELGVDYLAMPIPDGHVPSRSQVDQFVEAVKRTDGIVFVHCGGGVGRSSALTAAYLRATGRDAQVTEHVSLGQHTVQQLWYLVTGNSNVVVHGVSDLLDAPRRTWSRIRAAL